MIKKYRESNEEYFKKLYETPEGKAFLKTPQGKAVLEAYAEEEQKALEEQKAWGEDEWFKEQQRVSEDYEGKYERKKYIDEDGVWIPRIVGFLVFMLLGWLSANGYLGFEMFRYR